MVSERIQRQIDRFLDEAEAAVAAGSWDLAQQSAQKVLAFDPGNADALAFIEAARRALGSTAERIEDTEHRKQEASSGPSVSSVVNPTSFAGGRYQVKRFLGEGGKKRVYLAHDLTLARDVAFALIKTGGLDAEGRERITREAQAMGKLGTHPHVVSVFDMGVEPSANLSAAPVSGEEPEGTPFLVTELMQGGDIEGLLEKAPEHRLPVGDAVSLAIQVCLGLEFAHSHGLIHRDLKPGNVWLTGPQAGTETRAAETGGGGRPHPGGEDIGTAKIGDFGLAVSLDRSRLTRAGMMVGTVSYMPPEQAMGGVVSPRSDLYSLGAMLYEMVTGRPPFVGEESVAIITQHLNVPPVSPTWHRPDCPPGLEALILRLLEKDASKRPASAREVRQALESVRVPGPTSTDGEGAGTPATFPQAGVSAGQDDPLYRRTFVGREQELRRLQAAFDGAASGRGALVMVVGEPGIGKTALCEQLGTYVTVRGGKALVGHCYEEGSQSLPYLPFVEALRSYVLERDPVSLRNELGTAAGDVARIVSEVRDRVQVELRPSGDPEDDRWRLYQGITGFLRSAGAVQPLLVLLEDLHWSDRATLDMLVHLSRHLAGTRLLLVGTYRDVEVDRAHPLSATLAELRRAAEFQRVPLRGLTVDEVHRMLSGLTGQEMRWSLAEAVHRQTEGNPLFIQEVLRYLVEEGIISRQDGRYRRTGDEAPEMRIPEGLRDVIGRRLSRLSQDCNRLLAIAAVIGRDFDLETLHLVADTPEEPLVLALEEAVRVGVLEEQERRGAVHYRFSHAFFRQTLYEELSAPRRIRVHQQVARALETQHGNRLEEHGAELADHFSHSSDKEDLAKAVRYGELAAQRASAVYAHNEAAGLLESAMEVQEILDPNDGPKRCDLLLALGEALLPAGEPQRAADEVAEEAFRLAEEMGDPRRASRACRTGLAGMMRYGGGAIYTTPRWKTWTERAGRYAAPGSKDLLWAHNAKLWSAAAEERDRSDLFRVTMQLARDLQDTEGFLLSVQAGLNWGYSTVEEAVALAEEVAAWPRQGVSSFILSRALWFTGGCFFRHGYRDRAEQVWSEIDELAARSKDSYILLRPIFISIILATLDGRLEEALEAAAHFSRRAEELGSEGFARTWLPLLTLRPLAYLGRREELRGLAEGAWFGGVRVPVVRALVAAYGGRLDEAAAQLEAGMERLPSFRVSSDTWAHAVEAAVLTGRRDALPRPLPVAETQAGSLGGAERAPTAAARHLGAAYALLGVPDRARVYYQQAIDLSRRARFRPELALTRLQLAELLLEQYPDEQAEALEHLDFAIGEFQEMKMQPSLERALTHKGLLHA